MSCIVEVNWFAAKKTTKGFEYTAELTDVSNEGLLFLVDSIQIKVHNAYLLSNGLYSVQVTINSPSYIIENLLRSILND